MIGFVFAAYLAGLSLEGVKALSSQEDWYNGNFIYGGKETNITEVPYQVLLVGYKEKTPAVTCGGSIVAPRIVVTTATCVEKLAQLSFAQVFVGESKIFGGHAEKVAKSHIHPYYKNKSLDYDVGVVILAKRLKFSRTVRPIPVADSEPKLHSTGLVSGWGLNKNGNNTKTLQSLEVTVLTRKTCAAAFFRYMTSRMLCAGKMTEGICVGDSGGPLVVDGKLVGIASFAAKPCGNTKKPSGFVNVANPSIARFIKLFI